MPISRSAKKSLRKSVKNKRVNVAFKENLKELIKAYLVKPTAEGYKKVQSALDQAKKKNIFHINKISRIKSRLSKKYGETKTEVAVKKKVTTKKTTVKKTAKDKMSK